MSAGAATAATTAVAADWLIEARTCWCGHEVGEHDEDGVCQGAGCTCCHFEGEDE